MSSPVRPAIHPGELLRELYLPDYGLTAGSLARRLRVPRTRIERLVKEETPITTDTALRLAKFFGTTPAFWMNLQAGYDLKIEAEVRKDELALIEPMEAA